LFIRINKWAKSNKSDLQKALLHDPADPVPIAISPAPTATASFFSVVPLVDYQISRRVMLTVVGFGPAGPTDIAELVFAPASHMITPVHFLYHHLT